MSFQLASDYNDVPSRIAEFREKHPTGSLTQKSIDFREVAGGWWVIYTCAAYRSPDDPCPGEGTAWEPIPGKTPYTKDSEVQNAETSAWGRAIVAALAADTKKGIASAEEVRNRNTEEYRPQAADPAVLAALTAARGTLTVEQTAEFTRAWREHRFPLIGELTADQAAVAMAMLEAVREVKEEEPLWSTTVD